MGRPTDAVLVEERSIIRPPAGGVKHASLDVHATAALERLARWAARALRAPTALVSLVDTQDVVATRTSGASDAPATLALCDRVVAARSPLAIDDGGEGAAPLAFVGTPLIDSTGRVLGCLCVTDTRPRAWSGHDADLVSELAISATTELELRTARAVADREKRWSDGQAAVLELIAARAPLRTTLNELLQVSESHAPGMLTSILLLERTRGGDVLRHAAGPSLPRSFTSQVDGLAVRDGHGICATAAHRREPVIVLDVANDPLTARFAKIAAAHSLHSGWSTPIMSSRGDVLGTFALYYGRDRLPKPSDEIVIERSIHLARLAIEQSHDASALRRSARQARAMARDQTALQRVATGVAAETDPETLFRLIAEQVGSLLRADCGYVLRFVGEGEYETVGSWGRASIRVLHAGDVGPHAPDGLCAQLRGGHGVRRRSVQAGDHPLMQAHRIAAPIVVDRAPWGMIVALRDRFGGFPRDDEKRITRLAQLASVAVANASARERLATQALTDPLTGLANRRAFDQRLDEEAERALRHDRALSLMLVDVDRFKAINDRFGHAAGDRVLVDLTTDLQTAMRGGDLLARVGGDEMAMILADCGPRQAAEVACRMLLEIEEHASLQCRHAVTLSVGVAGLRPNQSADQLLRDADLALYRAKDAGRNQVVTYDAGLAGLVAPRARP